MNFLNLWRLCSRYIFTTYIVQSGQMLAWLKQRFRLLFPYGWRKLWWQPITPLKLRYSLRRLARGVYGPSHPFRIFLSLLNPYPWYLQVPRPQMTPRDLRRNPRSVMVRQDGIFQLRCIPLFQMRDTPERSVYRLYEYICAGLYEQVQYETEYFYFHTDPQRWSLDRIPDPKDANEERYAFVASIIEALAASFNWRLSLGLQRDRSRLSFSEIDARPPSPICAPQWAIAVPRLREPLVIADNVDHRKTPFEARNIIGANNGHMYSI